MKNVKFLKDFDFRPNAAVVVVHKAGEVKTIPEAQYDAALEAGAVELVNEQSAEQGATASEDGRAAERGARRSRSSD